MTNHLIPDASEREAFEAEVRKINSRDNVLERWPDGSYKHHGTDGRWEGWQMARAAIKAGFAGSDEAYALYEILDNFLAASAPAETAPEYVPIYKNVIDHNGKITGVEWVNAADAPRPITKEWSEKMAAREIEFDGNIEAGAETPKPCVACGANGGERCRKMSDDQCDAGKHVATPAATAATIGAGEGKDAALLAVRDAVAENLRDLYHCGRVWSAWGCGTMSEDDFSPAEEDEDIISNITDAVLAAMDAAMRSKTSPGEAG